MEFISSDFIKRYYSKFSLPNRFGGFFGVALIIIVSSVILCLAYFISPLLAVVVYESKSKELLASSFLHNNHLPTPKPVKALYLTGYAAGVDAIRERIFNLLEQTEANAVVIDIKDYSGRLYFIYNPLDKNVNFPGAGENGIGDIKELIASLHRKGVYVIGRVAAFQDPWTAKQRPDLAVKKSSNPSVVWRDHKGLSWIDPGSTEYWRYLADISLSAWELGFDEINFDYVRFPSDGDMSDIFYPISGQRPKAEVIESFFRYLAETLKPVGLVISADLFGMTTINTDDLNIGQVLERALPYFDYIAPMVYPSHYPSGFLNLPNPAAEPYKVVYYSMVEAMRRASTTPWKIRPWLQDFNLGGIFYDERMVRSQKQAVYDAGFHSWMLWNARNLYTTAALDTKVQED
jgi:hypothetical protein